MALINCPECGKQVSSQAAACPHCGIMLAGHAAVPPGAGLRPGPLAGAATQTPEQTLWEANPSLSLLLSWYCRNRKKSTCVTFSAGNICR